MGASVPKKPQPETKPDVLRDAIVQRLPRRTSAKGQVRWPAIPALADHYTRTLGAMFAGLGFPFSDEEQNAMRQILARKLTAGFKTSPFSKIVVDYQTDPPPNSGLSYSVSDAIVTMDDEYQQWVENRQPPLFGAHPDAKVMLLARSLGQPNEVAVLDVGAGTGRNTLPLAKAGFRVDAIELAPALAKVLREEIQQAGVSARVFEGDALDPTLEVPHGQYRLIVLAEVVASHFRDVGQLRRLFERISAWLAPGGLLLFSAFVADDRYEPDALARQASQVFWCCLFTRREFERARRGLPLVRVSDESTYDFERAHLPTEAWPPTGWFEDWARGQDLYHLPNSTAPHELRWLVYRKDATQHDSDAATTLRTRVSLHIARTPEEVFDFAVDPANFARIFGALPMVSESSTSAVIGAAELKAGARRRITLLDGSTIIHEVLELNRPLRHRYHWSSAPKLLGRVIQDVEADWTFTPSASGTTIDWTYCLELQTRLSHRMLRLPLSIAVERWMQRALEALRDALET
jgi:SAM-dependent methyltransferase